MPDSAIIGDQLEQMQGEVADKYEPRKFRAMVNVEAGLPVWATRGEYTKIEVASQMKLSSQYDTSVPLASHRRSSRTYGVIEAVNGYRVARDEVLRAQQEPGYNLDQTLALANQRKAEAVQQSIALLGQFNGSGVNADTSGLLNMPDIVDITANLTVNTCWVNAAGAVVQTDIDVILAQFDEIFADYQNVASEDTIPNRVIIPKYQAKALYRRTSVLEGADLVIDILRNHYQGVIFEVFSEANAISAGTDRLLVYSSDPEVQRCIIPEEYHDLEAVSEPLGAVVVPSVMKAGGCISNFPQGVQHFDMVRANTP